jgi:hypothetical protein
MNPAVIAYLRTIGAKGGAVSSEAQRRSFTGKSSGRPPHCP